VATALAGTGLYLADPAAPSCSSVALSLHHPAVFAGFLVNPHMQAPPFAQVALFTTDSGATWTLLPIPPGAGTTSFGGFRYRAKEVEALFTPRGSYAMSPEAYTGRVPPPVSAPLAEVGSDGGTHWSDLRLSCPSIGPCVSFGPYLPGNCAMNGTSQLLLRSSDAGATWSTPAWPSYVNACAPATLAALSPDDVLLFNSASPYLVQFSTDAGRSWQVLSMPAVPGLPPTAQSFGPGGDAAGLTLLPGGALLATGERPTSSLWELLLPGAKRWCTVRGLPAGTSRSLPGTSPKVIGSALWWMTAPSSVSVGGRSHTVAQAARSVEVSALHC
jgi:hypothetical protein